MIKKITLIAAMIGTIGLSTNILSSTCPTEFRQDTRGFWYSDEEPGWKSHESTPMGIKITAKNDFGGVVYSPTRQRLACVYRGSHNKWVVLVSKLHKDIQIDKNATDDSGKNPAWIWSEKHKDYACGRPNTTNINKCTFSFVKEQNKQPRQEQNLEPRTQNDNTTINQ